MLKIRPVWKADELKRFGELEEKYHYMGETHSGGDTLRLVIEDDGEWCARAGAGVAYQRGAVLPIKGGQCCLSK